MGTTVRVQGSAGKFRRDQTRAQQRSFRIDHTNTSGVGVTNIVQNLTSLAESTQRIGIWMPGFTSKAHGVVVLGADMNFGLADSTVAATASKFTFRAGSASIFPALTTGIFVFSTVSTLTTAQGVQIVVI